MNYRPRFVTLAEVKTTLVQTLDLFKDNRRWGQGSLRTARRRHRDDPTVPSYCLLGGIYRSTGAYEDDRPEWAGAYTVNLRTDAETWLDGWFRDHKPDGFYSIPMFNDSPMTTVDRVREVLNKAIEDLAEQIKEQEQQS